MVGLMAADVEQQISTLIDFITFVIDTPSKLDFLHQLKLQFSRLTHSSSSSSPPSFDEFLPSLLKLLDDCLSPVRKCVTELTGEIRLTHLEFSLEIIPALVTVVDDDTDTPAMARQAITSPLIYFDVPWTK